MGRRNRRVSEQRYENQKLVSDERHQLQYLLQTPANRQNRTSGARYERTAREKKYTAQQILDMRSEKVKPLLDQVYEIIHTLHPGKESALGRAVTYALN